MTYSFHMLCFSADDTLLCCPRNTKDKFENLQRSCILNEEIMAICNNIRKTYFIFYIFNQQEVFNFLGCRFLGEIIFFLYNSRIGVCKTNILGYFKIIVFVGQKELGKLRRGASSQVTSGHGIEDIARRERTYESLLLPVVTTGQFDLFLIPKVIFRANIIFFLCSYYSIPFSTTS